MDEFVIKVDLTSRQDNKDSLFDIRNFIIPLSLKQMHLDRFRFLKESKYCELAILASVSLDI